LFSLYWAASDRLTVDVDRNAVIKRVFINGSKVETVPNCPPSKAFVQSTESPMSIASQRLHSTLWSEKSTGHNSPVVATICGHLHRRIQW
jgi:hypothetical protein